MKDDSVPDTLLILSDGAIFSGNGFGKPAPGYQELLGMDFADAPLGEVVFNTSMGVYHEIITDPSYAGQIIVMTSVHMGNYGTDLQWNEMIGDHIFSRALVVRDVYTGPVGVGKISLAEQCCEWNLCGITDVDTRALTLHIRNHGSQYGVLVQYDTQLAKHPQQVCDYLGSVPPMLQRDFVTPCTVAQPKTYTAVSPVKGHYALWDFGTKQSIIQQLLALHISVTVFPAQTPVSQIVESDVSYDALFLSNGPGDPAALSSYSDQLAAYLGKIPILGICLGHQLAAQALGGKTDKMLFGHHGSNHPVRDLGTQNVYVTAQNHGYCVLAGSLPDSTQIWLINDNDGTIEGMFDDEKGLMTVQFHPEAAPGPWEGRSLFPRFIAWAAAYQKQQKGGI